MKRSDYNSNGWHQFGYKQAACKDDGHFLVFRSYFTNVALLDKRTGDVYLGRAARKYSVTTSKHVTQFLNALQWNGLIDGYGRVCLSKVVVHEYGSCEFPDVYSYEIAGMQWDELGKARAWLG